VVLVSRVGLQIAKDGEKIRLHKERMSVTR